MTTHFVLVDFENVQPKSLGALSPDGAHVRIFAGASQSKVDLGLAQALQPFGTKAEYIQIVGKPPVDLQPPPPLPGLPADVEQAEAVADLVAEEPPERQRETGARPA